MQQKPKLTPANVHSKDQKCPQNVTTSNKRVSYEIKVIFHKEKFISSSSSNLDCMIISCQF